MAFSGSQRASIRKFMCATLRHTDSTELFYPLEDAMDVVGGDEDSAELVLSVIAEIEAIETKITALHELAHIRDAEDITLRPGSGVYLLRAEGRRKIRIISDVLGLKPLGDYFSAPKVESELSGWLF